MKVIPWRTVLTVPGVVLAILAMVPAAGHERLVTLVATAELPADGKITVVGKEFEFLPNAIRVRKRQHVTIIFKNEGKLSHNLTIPNLGLHTKTIQRGMEVTLEFTAKEAGTFQFWCKVPGHKQAGMRGDVVVTQ